jgi:F1F0 ATPase subunit 2
MIDQIHILALTALAGIGLGFFYFGGLWLTIKRMPDSQHQAPLLIGSFLGRNAVCFAAFILMVRGGHWERVAACMLGFLAARIMLVRRLRPKKRAYNMQEGDEA